MANEWPDLAPDIGEQHEKVEPKKRMTIAGVRDDIGNALESFIKKESELRGVVNGDLPADLPVPDKFSITGATTLGDAKLAFLWLDNLANEPGGPFEFWKREYMEIINSGKAFYKSSFSCVETAGRREQESAGEDAKRLRKMAREAEDSARGETRRAKAFSREVSAMFVESDPKRPWLEPRPRPMLPGIPISEEMIVPGGLTEIEIPGWSSRRFQHPGKYFNTVSRFYLPSEQYRKYFAETSNRSESDVPDPVDNRVFKLVYKTLAPLDLPENPEWRDFGWLNWARTTKIIGLDPLIAKRRQDEGLLFKQSSEEAPLQLNTKQDLLLARDQLIAKTIERKYPDWKDAKIMWKITAAARWNVENHLESGSPSLSELLEFYSELNYLEETSYENHYPMFCQINSFARVLSGGRAEAYYPDAAFAGNPGYSDYDEVDAIFRLAVHLFGEDSPGLRRIKEARGEDEELPRYCMFGSENKDHHNADPAGLVLAMAQQYFRMDESLRAVWRPYLDEIFRLAGEKAASFLGKKEPSLVMYGTAEDGVERNLDTRHCDHLVSALEAQGDIEELSLFDWFSPGPITVHGFRTIAGPGAERLKAVYREEVQTLRDERGKSYTNVNKWTDIIPIEEPPSKEIELVSELNLALRAENRLSEEAAGLVREVASDPEAGNLDRMGSVKRIVERLTGREIDDLDITHTITALGNLKLLGQEAHEAGRDTASGLLLEARLGNRAFADLDPASQMLLVLRCCNRLPKELVIEHLLQAMEGAMSLSLLRYAVTMEKVIREQRPWETEDSLFQFPLFTGREEIKVAKEKYGETSQGYERVVLETDLNFLRILHAHHEYESSISDYLVMLDVLEETGRPMSQCSELAFIAAEMQNWMIGGENPSSFPAYREMHPEFSLGQWLDWIKIQPDWSFDHIKVYTDLPAPKENVKRELVIDETVGEAFMTNRTVPDRKKTSQMQAGEYRHINNGAIFNYAARQFHWGVKPEGLLIYGSRAKLSAPRAFLADIVGMFPNLETYTRVLNPDSVRFLTDQAYSLEDRKLAWLSLDRLLAFAPRSLADEMPGKQFLLQKTLGRFLELAMENQAYEKAIFLFHVAKVRIEKIDFWRLGMSDFRKLAVDRLALCTEEDLRGRLPEAEKNGFLLPSDTEEIWSRFRAVKQKAEKQAREEKTSVKFQLIKVAKGLTEKVRGAVSILSDSVKKIDNVDVETGIGDEVSRKIRADVAEVSVDFRQAHQVEAPAEATTLLSRFVDLDQSGAGFAVAEIVRGLEPDEARRMLTAVEILVLKSETEFGYSQLPGGVEAMWAALQAAMISQGSALPYSREELRKNLPSIVADLKLNGGSAAKFIGQLEKPEFPRRGLLGGPAEEKV